MMCSKLISGSLFFVLVAGLAVGTAQAGVSFTDPPGGWTYLYTGDLCATQVDAALDGKWHHYDASSGGSDAWDGTAPGQMGTAPTKPSPGGAGVFTDAGTTFLRIQDCGDPRDAPNGGWAEPTNRKLTFAHNLTGEVTNGTSILDDGVTLSFRARIPTTPPLDPNYPDGGGGPQPWVTSGYNIHDSGDGAFGIKQGRSGLGVVSFSLAMDGDEGDISGNGLTMNKRVGTSRSGSVDSYDSGGTENTLTGFDPTQWHEFWIQIVGDTSGGGTHKVTIWMDGDISNPKTFHVTAGNKHEGSNYNSWDGYLLMSLGRTDISGAQDVDFFGYKGGLHAPISALKPGLASGPTPGDGQTNVYYKSALGWTPGEFAGKHDVYLGMTREDVDNASRDNPLDVLAKQGQDANTYVPAGALEFDRTYYWRVDEVNAPPSSAIYKGKVWSFTTEPRTLQIQNVTATASISLLDMGPERAVNGSGLDKEDHHSTEPKEMWLSAGVQPDWIQFEFDRAYKLHELWVWNSNQAVEGIVGFGSKSVLIDYSVDGSAWTSLTDVPEFARATGTPDYGHNTVVNLAGASAKYVKLTINSTWGGVAQSGLSEVRFFYVPVQARLPVPDANATGQEVDVTLSWRPGREATSHKVYLSSDRQAVADGTSLAGAVTDREFDATGLNLAATYYWRVDEVNEAATPSSWEGEIWQFATKPSEIVDDFESYTNDSPNRVFQTWVDGVGYSADEFFPVENLGNGSGAAAGHDIWTETSPYYQKTIMETRVVAPDSKQSVPLDYDNAASPFYSQADRTWTSPQNWKVGGADTLALYFVGQAVSFVADPSGKITMGSAGADIWGTADQFRFAWKPLTGNGTIVAKVESLERTSEWAKAGVMIRESLDPGSRFATVFLAPDFGCRFQARLMTSTDATSDTSMATAEQAAIRAPYWVKLERTGDDFKGYYSADGTTWTPMVWNPRTITMAASTVYIGLAVTSHNTNPQVTTTAVFSGVTTSTNVTGQWQVVEIGVDSPENSLQDLYVTIQDNLGKNATVTYPGGTTLSSWTDWKISFSQFAGVNMGAVKKMTIGVGNKTAPKQGDAGTVYFDDVRLLRSTP